MSKDLFVTASVGADVLAIAQLEHIRARLAEIDTNDVEERAKLSREISALSDERRYGDGLKRRLAEALGLSEEELRRYVWVGKTWTAEEIDEILCRKNPAGMPITWSHLTTLALIRDKAKRDELLELCFTQVVAVRTLKELAKSDDAAGEPPVDDEVAVDDEETVCLPHGESEHYCDDAVSEDDGYDEEEGVELAEDENEGDGDYADEGADLAEDEAGDAATADPEEDSDSESSESEVANEPQRRVRSYLRRLSGNSAGSTGQAENLLSLLGEAVSQLEPPAIEELRPEIQQAIQGEEAAIKTHAALIQTLSALLERSMGVGRAPVSSGQRHEKASVVAA
jgi:hypothetical protein